MAIAVSATAAGLQVALYDRRAEGTWYFSELPRIVAITFALSVLFGAGFELRRLIGGRVLLKRHLGAIPSSHQGRARPHVSLLAMLLKPRRHIERVAEIRDLAVRITAFADRHGASMECRPELRNRTELLAIGARVFGNPICNSKKAVDGNAPPKPRP
jgi:hypothetical protein